MNLVGCWRRETWRPQKSRSRGLNSCRGTGVECRRRAASHINPSSSGNKCGKENSNPNPTPKANPSHNHNPSYFCKYELSLAIPFSSLSSIHVHRKSKDDTWVSNNTYWELRKDAGFSHQDFPTLWWPLTCWPCTCFQPVQLPPPNDTRLVLVEVRLQSHHLPQCSLIALIAKSALCFILFMQSCHGNVNTCWRAHTHTHIIFN